MEICQRREKQEDNFDKTKKRRGERREDKRVEDIRSRDGGGRGEAMGGVQRRNIEMYVICSLRTRERDEIKRG